MKKKLKLEQGVSLTEVLIYIGVFSIIIVVIISFVFWFIRSNARSRVMRETLNNAKRVMETINQEIREAEKVYLPTSSNSQLSLKTRKYLAPEEEFSYIDFYLCDSTRICFKKESQDPVYLTSDNVKVDNLTFTQILSGESPSVQIDLEVSYNNPSDRPEYESSVSLTSSSSLRLY